MNNLMSKPILEMKIQILLMALTADSTSKGGLKLSPPIRSKRKNKLLGKLIENDIFNNFDRDSVCYSFRSERFSINVKVLS